MVHELPQPSLLTVAEVACYLRVSETTVWRWCGSGKLPAFRLGRGWRVRRDDLDLMIASMQGQHTPLQAASLLSEPTPEADER